METTDKFRLQSKISEIVYKDNKNTAHFEFTSDKIENKVKASLITYNPKTDASFLLKSVKTDSEIEALEEILAYLESLHNDGSYQTYTIKWYDSEDKVRKDRPNKSYFAGKDLYEILDKFYYGKNKQNLTIYSIRLNPMS